MPQTSQVFNQRAWPLSGDVDDCWVVATIWCANAVAPWLFLQTTTAFRKAAGDPDDGNADGGRLSEIMRACDTLWPQLNVQQHVGTWNALRAKLDAGHVASVAVVSELLPTKMQYGFTGLHQVAFYVKDGNLRMMNPLDKDRSRPDDIGNEAARVAAKAYGDGVVYAAVFPTEAEAFKTHPLYQPTTPGTYTQADLDAALKAATDPLNAANAKLKTDLAASIVLLTNREERLHKINGLSAV